MDDSTFTKEEGSLPKPDPPSDAAGLGGTVSESAPAPSRPGRSRIWVFAAAMAAIVLLLLLTPLRNLFPLHTATKIASGGAQNDYLQAQDLLDHYYKPNSLEKSVALFQKATGEDAKFAPAFAGLCRANWYLFRSSRNAELVDPARLACEHALELDPDLASAHVTLGMIYTQCGKMDLASEELQHAVKLDATNADAYGALAELYAAQGRDADVEPDLQRAVDLSPTAWRWLNQLGQYYQSKGELDRAAAQFQQAIKVAPDNARAYNNLGITYARQSRWADARAAYEKSLQLEPAYNTQSNLGTVLEEQGDYSAAAAAYRRAIDLNPSDYISWGNLASATMHLPGQEATARSNYEKAIVVGEETHQRQPNDARLLADLGRYYALIGNVDKSLPLLRQATALAPDDPQVLYFTAEGYEALHRRKDALLWMRKALSKGFPMDTVRHNGDLSGLTADPAFPANATAPHQP
jgi:Tfp pilus assembly protein PilF